MIRIAWYDKKYNKYDYGSWHNVDTLKVKQSWINTQNKLYHSTHYWLEESAPAADAVTAPNAATAPDAAAAADAAAADAADADEYIIID
jgi:hypothetical protein